MLIFVPFWRFDSKQISNLLANAQKYTDKGGIVVCMKLLDEDEETVTIEISVKDTGYDNAKNNAVILLLTYIC